MALARDLEPTLGTLDAYVNSLSFGVLHVTEMHLQADTRQG
jgi:hypothetical protein